MKKTIVAALAAALMSSGAYAADAFDRGSTKDAGIFSAPAAVNWSGLYLGGAIGYGNSNHDLSVQDYWKDYCDKAHYSWTKKTTDGIDTWTPTLSADGGDKDPAKDLDRFYGHGEEALAACAAPTAVTGTREAPQPRQPGSYQPVGVQAGDSREIGNLDGLNAHGLVGDGRIGFDVQRGRFVFGVFGSYGFNNMEAAGSGLDGARGLGDFTLEKGDEWSVGGRAGLLVNPRTLAYIMAAYTQTDYELKGTHGFGAGAESFSRETTFDGVTVGGGVEFALTNNVFLGVEGTHTFYGKETIYDRYNEDHNKGLRIEDELGETKVLGTLKIKLNTGLGGVID